MQTIASLAEKLDMTAQSAVEVLRKLRFDIADVNTEIDDDTVDLLLDMDEDDTVFEKKSAEIEKEEEKKRKKAVAAAKKKEVAAKKAEAAAAKKAAAEKKKAEAEEKKAEAAKKKEEAAIKKAAEAEEKKKTAAAKKAAAKKTVIETPEGEENKEEGEPAQVSEVSPESETVADETATDETATDETVAVVPVEEEGISEVEVSVSDASSDAEDTSDTPKTTPPRAEIIVESEEEARVAAELLDKAREDGTHAEGKLAAAEHRREEEERRRVTREKERQEKKVQGPVVSDIAPDPEVVAAVMRRNEDRKRKAEEDKARRQRRRPAGSERKKPLSAPISEPLAPVAPVVASPNKTKGKPDQSGLSKTARKKAKRAERNRLRAENSRREAAEAVKNFQAGTITGGSRKKRRRRRDEQMVETTEQQVLGGGIIEVDEMVTVQILANLMDMPVTDLILTLMDEDMSATKNQTLDMAVVRLIAGKFNFEVRVVIPEEEELFAEEKDDPAQLQGRPPVVTVMGHVDHGKTSLLDVIRSAKVAEGEAGGITQHIAAYDIEVSDGRVTFLDTPGHQAFTEMRARGAHVTDVVVLVVAANDGVKPQTIEAIDHAQAAEVPIVVAINKCDLDNAQPDRVRQELSQHGLVDDAWGGKTIMRDISAKMNQGIDELMELLVLQTDMLELKANPEKRARGTIVESEIAVGLGPVAWVLVQNGTLRIGDIFLAGTTYGRVRSMITCRNENVEEAGPSTPVLVTGFDAPPDAGDIFITVPEERVARNIAEQRASRLKLKRSTASKHMTLEDFHAHFDGKEQKKLKMIIKSDVQGSVDVLRTSFAKMGNEEVSINVIHSGVGGINESDVVLAEASDAVIIGFHVTANAKVQKLAEQVGVDVHTYRIIYEALDEVRSSLEGMLTPDQKEIILGHAEVRQIFASSALGNIAGCYQTDGESQRNASARLVRDGVVIYEGNISSLRRKKDDARSVATGFECGIKLEKYNDIHIGDIIEVFKVELVAKTLKEEMQ